jgi:dephospho-CoA kinase
VRIVGIAGAIGSGKSELSRALARELDAERLSFGDFVRREGRGRGVEPTRENLQQLGEQLIDELGAPEFVRRVLSERPPTDLLVVDGVRHLAVDEALRKIAAQYVLVFATVDDDTRRRRLVERKGHDVDLTALDQHSTEREVPLLRERAATVVDGTDSGAAVERVRELLS